jgi:hypothetical protein
VDGTISGILPGKNFDISDVELSALRPGRFTQAERALGGHWKGSWVGLSAGLDNVE